jgi:hypothetical protein
LAADPRTTPGLDTVGLINTGSNLVANRAQQQLVNGRTVTVTDTTIVGGVAKTTTVTVPAGAIVVNGGRVILRQLDLPLRVFAPGNVNPPVIR